ncbi:Uncharacterised protein [Actinobaculum suis]|uniref:Uncharacterized protein n=1 Tax=Actinobaculum suis TaxID=1657 RepID=A0A7Z9C873_9ACTO|nr:Uncharacterised protein [Actinobaculum suis]
MDNSISSIVNDITQNPLKIFSTVVQSWNHGGNGGK